MIKLIVMSVFLLQCCIYVQADANICVRFVTASGHVLTVSSE